MTEIEIAYPDPDTGGTRLVVDGVDLSMEARSASIEVGSGRPRVRVEFVANESFRLCSADAELIIDEGVAEMLVKNGWTRPRATGGPVVVGGSEAMEAAKRVVRDWEWRSVR